MVYHRDNTSATDQMSSQLCSSCTSTAPVVVVAAAAASYSRSTQHHYNPVSSCTNRTIASSTNRGIMITRGTLIYATTILLILGSTTALVVPPIPASLSFVPQTSCTRIGASLSSLSSLSSMVLQPMLRPSQRKQSSCGSLSLPILVSSTPYRQQQSSSFSLHMSKSYEDLIAEQQRVGGGGSSSSGGSRFPEQYPACYEMNTYRDWWKDIGDPGIVRPLLKNTQLERRALQVVYDANQQGWNTKSFHRAVDGKGAAIVIAKGYGTCGWFGGYNPKGWAGLGGTRPSVAAFLFYTTTTNYPWYRQYQKLKKLSGGGLACAKDDPTSGIWLGADGLIIPLQPNQPRLALSRLGTYYERGPNSRDSIFTTGGISKLMDLKVLVGVYPKGEEIPYSGGVLDFTSG